MFEKVAAFILCFLVIAAAVAIIWITAQGYNRRVLKASGVRTADMAQGPQPKPTKRRKKRQAKKRRGRR